MARRGACRAQSKSRFRRCKISQRRTAQETPPPLKQVVVLADAAEDLEAARDFYNGHEPGVGEYCIDSLLTDIESLGRLSGIHPLHFDFHRMLASRFPFGIYYQEVGDETQVFAVLDLRRNPNWIRTELGKRAE